MRMRIFVVPALAAALAPAGRAAAVTSPNLLVNPGAEAAAGSADGGPVAVPGRTVKGPFTAVKWGAACPGGCPTASAYPKGGANLFAGGRDNASSLASQDVGVAKYASAIDRGGRQVWIGAALGGWADQHDAATVQAIFFGKDGKSLGSAKIGGDTYAARKGATAFVTLGRKVSVPAGTRTIRVAMIAKRTSGAYNDAYFDDLVLKFVS